MGDPLIIDTYYGDGVKPSQWSTVALAGMPWAGAILQACNGTDASAWFVDSWEPLALAGGPRGGIDWFRGAYAYFRVRDPLYSCQQAETFLSTIDAAGGWGDCDLWPFVDVERVGNVNTSAQQVVDCTSTWADWILRRCGRTPVLYAGSYFRDLGITDHCGCQMLWFPRWTATLPESAYKAIGWTRAELWGWQYCGDGTAELPNYPHTTPIGKLDITAIVMGDAAGAAAPLEFTRSHRGVTP